MSKSMIRRPTAFGLALAAAAAQLGIDADPAALPVKREPVWSVTRRGPRSKRK
jgi:hypothetical protein